MKSIGFLARFGNETVGSDTNNIMIQYTNIPLHNYDVELGEFYIYFKTQLERRVENLSPELSNKIIQKIFELFSNVFRHSCSELGLFCSGQCYPRSNKFYFTIVDGGITIKNNVNRFLNKKRRLSFLKNKNEKNGLECIQWSLEEKNSTTGEGGGLGLSLLKALIIKSDGELDIISNDGYYSIKDKKESGEILNKPFNGTIISIGLDTNTEKYYYLSGEQNDN